MAAALTRALAWPWSSRHLQHQRQHDKSQDPNTLPVSEARQPSPLSLSVKDGSDPQREPVWLPAAPSIPRPRASYNAASLAYLGDCIYELYVRCHFLTPPQSIDKFNSLVMSLVCCEAQDAFLKQLLKDNFLLEEERQVVRWGKNVQTNHKRATKRAGTAVYCGASSLETLIGYLYLTNPVRLEAVMRQLGLYNWKSSVDRDGLVLKVK